MVLKKTQGQRLYVRKEFNTKIGGHSVSNKSENIIMNDRKNGLQDNDEKQIPRMSIQNLTVFKNHYRIDHIADNQRQYQID